MGSKGSQTTTQQTGPPGYVQAAYQNLINQAGNVAGTPYAPYTGELTAPINPQQQAGVGGINQYAFSAQPAVGTAEQYIQGAAQPLTQQQIQNYYNPYQQDVINATQANFAEGNAQQQQQVLGNAAAQGALGGDRVGVAQAELARQQNLSQAPVIAGLQQQGYNQSLGTAGGQYQANPQAAAYALGNIGIAGQQAGLTGAGAQFGAGTAEQQTQQALDTALQQAYWQQFYYPEQQTQWQAGIDTAVGSGAGGTSDTTGPAPSFLGQLLGLGIAGAGAYGAYQGAQKERGGRIKGYDLGGSPVANDPYTLSSIIGVPQLTRGPGPPKPPGTPQQQQPSAQDMLKNASNIAGMFKHGTGGAGAGAGVSGGPLDILGGGAAAGTGVGGLGSAVGDVVPVGEGLGTLGGAAGLGVGTDLAATVGVDAGAGAAADLLPLLLLANRGGRMPSRPIRSGLGMASFVPRRRGYQEGGSPSIEDRFGPFANETNEPIYDVTNTGGNRAAGLGALATLMPQGEPPSATAFGTGAAGLGPGAAYTQANPYAPSRDEEELPPVMRSAPQGISTPAYDEGRPTGGLQAPQEAPARKTGPFGLSQDFYTSLMAAGLGTMAAAGRPGATPLGSIGQGGLSGVGEYSALQKQHLSEQEVANRAKQLDNEAKYHQDVLAQQERHFTTMSAAEKAQQAFREEQLHKPVPLKDAFGVEHLVDPRTGKPIGDPTPSFGVPTTPGVSAPPMSGGPAPEGDAAIPASAAPVQAQQKPMGLPTAPNSEGEAYIAGLPAEQQAIIRGIASGNLPTGPYLVARNPAIMSAVMRYDPSFTYGTAAARAAAQKNFGASGVEARNFQSNDMAIKHIGSGLDNIEAMGNITLAPSLNAPYNAIRREVSPQFQQARTALKVDIDAVGNELMRSFRGSGSASEKEAVEWKNNFPINGSPVEQRTAFREAANLLASRISAAAGRYNDAMGPYYSRDPYDWLSPEGRDVVRFTAQMNPQEAIPKNWRTVPSGFHAPGAANATPTTGTVDARDAAALKANAGNPAAAAAIDKKYGVGTAARLLGDAIMADDFVLPSDAPESGGDFTLPSESQAPAVAPTFAEKLGQTWPARLAKSAWQAATLPGDVATGATDVAPTTPGQWSDEDEARLQLTNAEIANRASNAAAFMTPGSAAVRAGEGIFGVPTAARPIGQATVPTIPELKQAAVAGYESPTVAGVQIQAKAGPRLSQEIQTNLNNEGIDENLAPKTFGILGKLSKAPEAAEGEPPPFLTVDNLRSLRRTLGNAASSIDPTERLAAKSAQQHLDEFLSNLPAADVISGNPKAAAAILAEANGNYAAMKQAADLDTRMTKAYLRAKAANSGMNVANTIRQRMVDIATNPKLGRGLTPDEMEQVKTIAEGTPTENLMRGAGNILGGGGGLLSAGWLASGLGTHGISSLAPIAGYTLRKISNAMATRKAANLGESIRLRSPMGQQRQLDALGQTARPSLAPGVRALPAAQQAVSPYLQLPAAVEAEPQQDRVPGIPAQQQNGGAVRQQRASGGKVGDSGHKDQVESKFDPKSIGARQAKNGRWYLPDPHRQGKFLMLRVKNLHH